MNTKKFLNLLEKDKANKLANFQKDLKKQLKPNPYTSIIQRKIQKQKTTNRSNG